MMRNAMPRKDTLFEDEVQAPLAALASRKTRDPVGMWYAARARHGVDDRMWFALYEGESRVPRWHTVSHRHSDGLGALPLLLAERGFRAGPPPQGRPETAPDWRQLWRAQRAARAAPVPRIDLRWRWRDPSLAACAAHAPVSVLLSPEQTRAIDAAAAAAGVSTTMWLQWSADRALRSTLAERDSVAGWLFPVNLRGSVPAPDAYANQCSGLTLRLGPDSPPRAVRQQVAERFALLEHWRQWLLLNLGRWVGQAGVNLLYRLSRAAPGAWAGSYSNLGEWNVPGLSGIACTAPGSPAYPVAVGTVLCNGRRTLACRLHPVIGGNARRAIEYLTHWREQSLQGAPVVASPTAQESALPA